MYDKRHGGPYDRGSADRYYGRRYNPHCYEGATGSTPLIKSDEMTIDALEAYDAGWNEETERKYG